MILEIQRKTNVQPETVDGLNETFKGQTIEKRLRDLTIS